MRLTFVAVMLAAFACAQESEVRTRQLWDQSLMTERPAAPAVKQAAKPPVDQVHGLVGITVWRLRPAQTADRREIRALIQEDGADVEFTPERVSADQPLREGQKVRISVESGETGYLYIIDRDEYADGTKDDPYLIFPTTRTRGGDNRVKAGVVIQIPAAEDSPSYYKVERSRPDQVSDTVTIFVTPKPIAGLQLTRNRMKLTEQQLKDWQAQAQTKSYKLESKATVGQAQTVAEHAASRGASLTQADPLPQTMYRVASKPGDTLMVQLPLKIAK
jgi:Domain of unknown function (DUF4384)